MKREGRLHDAHTKSAETAAIGAKMDRRSRGFVNAVSKSRDKSKGNKKMRFSEISLNRKFYCKIDGGGRGGASAAEFARSLDNYQDDDNDDEEEEEVTGDERWDLDGENPDLGADEVGGAEREDIRGIEEDDDFGFFHVAVLADYQDDGWCVVEEI